MTSKESLRLRVDNLLATATTRQCVACSGSGRYDVGGSPNCSACEGTGRELVQWLERDNLWSDIHRFGLRNVEPAETLLNDMHRGLVDLGIEQKRGY